MKTVTLLLAATFLLLLPLASADLGLDEVTLEPVQANTCVQLEQTCSNCTFVNISSITLANKQIISVNDLMDNLSPSSYNYTFCQTQEVGDYSYISFGDPNGQIDVARVNFAVTITGTDISTAQGILYLIGFALLVPIFIMCLYGGIRLPYDNPRGQDGYLLGINYLKYAKILLWTFAYLTFLGITYLAWNVFSVFLGASSIGTFFQFFFWILVAGMLPIAAISFIVIIKNMVNDKRILDGINRGLKLE